MYDVAEVIRPRRPIASGELIDEALDLQSNRRRTRTLSRGTWRSRPARRGTGWRPRGSRRLQRSRRISRRCQSCSPIDGVNLDALVYGSICIAREDTEARRAGVPPPALLQAAAAVDRQRDAGDVAGLVRCQEEHRVGDVLGLYPADRGSVCINCPTTFISSGPGFSRSGRNSFIVPSFMDSGVFTLVGCTELTRMFRVRPRMSASGPPHRVWRLRSDPCGDRPSARQPNW